MSSICLAFPESVRERRHSHATFRVRSRVFAYYLDDHHGDAIVSVCCRTARGENADWVAADPSRFYLPAYIGPRGWVGLRLDVGPVDWGQVAEFLTESYRLAAPKRLAAGLPAVPVGAWVASDPRRRHRGLHRSRIWRKGQP